MNEFQALNRTTFGPIPSELEALKTKGWSAWVEEQLNPGPEPPELEKRIKDFSLEVIAEVQGREKNYRLGIKQYYASAPEIWKRLQAMGEDPPEFEIRRPTAETFVVTWLKALHSPWQLRELMIEFWHNHFNVSVEAEQKIQSLFAIYDREVIRPNALGNFRTFLEAVAKSPCMLYYLDNAYSRASPANENYARELFELHTLGADHYFNHLYDEWRKVPGAWEGAAEGYIDEDVYEAARAFTGWTVADNRGYEQREFPATGEFYYYDNWHDHYQKRVLGVEFKSHQPPMADGLKVLDILANHPGTARFVCGKLCKWLVADEPPTEVVDAAVKTWMDHREAEGQIAQTVKTILLSSAFTDALDTKIKRPNHLAAAFLRGTQSEAKPSQGLYWWVKQMGYQQFAWPTPTGHPDDATYWLNSDMILKRWKTFPLIAFWGEEDGFVTMNVQNQLPIGCEDFTTALKFWSERLLGQATEPAQAKKLKDIFFEDLGGLTFSAFREQFNKEFEIKLRQMVCLLAMSPHFQKR